MKDILANDNAEEFVVLDELLNLAIVENDDLASGLLFPHDLMEMDCSVIEEKANIYQICGINEKPEAIIKYIGISKKRPTIKIHEFTFKRCKCEIVSYLLSDPDIKLADDRCTLKMLGMIITCNKGIKKNKVIAAITFSFHTFVHKRDKKSILDYVTFGETKKYLTGFFGYELKYVDEFGIINEKRIGEITQVFPGKTKCVYKLVDFLSDDKLSFLFI